MSGSKNLEDSIDYMVDLMKSIGLENVHTENASVPHWERGFESAILLTPRKEKLTITGLGSSTGTPPGGIIGNVIAVKSFDEFEEISAEKVRGTIVVFAPDFVSYGETSSYRYNAASVAARKGAVAVLVRSITSFSISSPHAGQQRYARDVKKIPAAAITIEQADMILRLYKKGVSLTIRLEMQSRNLGMFESRNTIAELTGDTKKPVVVLSGHLDSWDLGVGAMDDGGGSFISWKALELLRSLDIKKAKRTIRAVLWTGEEQGTYGAKAYAEQHKSNEEKEFNFFIESDTGTFEPVGLAFSGNLQAECIFSEIMKLMSPLNATQVRTPISGGPDINAWVKRGFPGAALLTKNDRYFWFHHTDGDSMLVENSVDLDKNTALFAAVAYVIADLSIDFPKTIEPLT